VKGATVTVGSDDVSGLIVSEITIGGGETEKNVLSAMNGSNFTCFGTQADFDVSFDMVVTDIKPAQYIYGSGSTVGDVTTVTFSNDGSQTKNITIAFPANANGDTMTYLFSGAQAVSGIPKFAFGQANVMTLSFTCNPDQTTAAIDINT